MKKETYEWMRAWSDHSTSRDLPRVLLVGDSITDGYQPFVREALAGKCYVDHIAMSYAFDQPFYHTIIKTYLHDNHYDIIHLNHGLHGIHMTDEEFDRYYRELISEVNYGPKIILTTCTKVINPVGRTSDWPPVVPGRNKIILNLAKEFNLPVDDLYAVSETCDSTMRSPDGTHYVESGYRKLTESVVKSIIKEL